MPEKRSCQLSATGRLSSFHLSRGEKIYLAAIGVPARAENNQKTSEKGRAEKCPLDRSLRQQRVPSCLKFKANDGFSAARIRFGLRLKVQSSNACNFKDREKVGISEVGKFQKCQFSGLNVTRIKFQRFDNFGSSWRKRKKKMIGRSCWRRSVCNNFENAARRTHAKRDPSTRKLPSGLACVSKRCSLSKIPSCDATLFRYFVQREKYKFSTEN